MLSKKFFLLGILFLNSCNATEQIDLNLNFKEIFLDISSKSALRTSFIGHMKKIGSLCTRRDKNDVDYDRKGNVKCVSDTGITQFAMSGTETPAVTMIDATVSGTEKCAYMRSVLTQQYGKPAQSKGTCDSTWVLNPGKGRPLIHLRLEKDTKKNEVYFAYQEEQGP